MKKMLIALTIMLGSINLSASAATTTGTATFGVKQTIVFSDNSQIEIFYVQTPDGYKVCSETDFATQSFDKLLSVKSTTMELCRQYKGEVQYHAASLDEVRAIANKLVRQFNSWLNAYQHRTGKSLNDILSCF